MACALQLSTPHKLQYNLNDINGKAVNLIALVSFRRVSLNSPL